MSLSASVNTPTTADAAKARLHPFAPDVVTPDQFHGEGPAASLSTGERSLMLAVLEDGIRCFQEFSQDPRLRPRMLARQAETWIESRDTTWPFSFENVCSFLDLDAGRLRTTLLRSRDEPRAGRPRRASHRVCRLSPTVRPR
ncbi:hypothetical protein KGQ64_07980 [bacterium]|nr:hypothetical protein [bacterium]